MARRQISVDQVFVFFLAWFSYFVLQVRYHASRITPSKLLVSRCQVCGCSERLFGSEKLAAFIKLAIMSE